MKFQPKRFVVEVKRGTSRAAFSSPDASQDKFSNAEATLFGGAPKSEGAALQSSDTPPSGAATRAETRISTGAPRRILESLIEEPAAPVIADDSTERPRRGRKPGSKNKPKPAPPASRDLETSAFRSLSPDAQAFMRAPFSSEPAAARHTLSTAEHRVTEPARIHGSDATGQDVRPDQRQRLRERSSIIKRYVLGTEPKPGQFGSLRARRKARAAG